MQLVLDVILKDLTYLPAWWITMESNFGYDSLAKESQTQSFGGSVLI